MVLQNEVSAALTTLGANAAPVVDAVADPAGALRALDRDEVVLRVAPELGAAVEGYAPAPAEPLWARITRGSSEITTVPLRGGAKEARRAVSVAIVEETTRCCDAASCTLEKRHTAAWLALAGAPRTRLLITEQRGEGDAVHAVARRLAAWIGVPVEPDSAAASTTSDSVGDPLPQLSPAELARYAIRSEGDRFVLRDWSSVGPRTTARRNAVIGVALMVVAAALWFQLVQSLRAGATGPAVGFGAAAALFTLAGYAFIGVARFSSLYRARSSPLVILGRDRLVVAPWVSRAGAVDLRPEGRLGAAIPLNEVRSAAAKSRDGQVAVEFDTDHGPIDALYADESAARFWTAVMNRLADEVRHPRTGASARQRARAR